MKIRVRGWLTLILTLSGVELARLYLDARHSSPDTHAPPWCRSAGGGRGGRGGGRTPYAWIGGDLNPGIVSREGVWVRESRHSVPARVHRMILRLASRIDGVDRYKSI